jgi:predicted RNase H-like HicB family nuclease
VNGGVVVESAWISSPRGRPFKIFWIISEKQYRFISRMVWPKGERMRRFLIVIEKAGKNYSAYSPDLHGCVATGATREEAGKRLHDAIELQVKGLVEELLKLQTKPFITDTSTLYTGRRHNAIDHTILATERGFSVEGLGIPFLARNLGA